MAFDAPNTRIATARSGIVGAALDAYRAKRAQVPVYLHMMKRKFAAQHSFPQLTDGAASEQT